jgi:hypothetical protein
MGAMIKYAVVIAAVAGIFSAMPAGAEEVGVGVGRLGITVGEGDGDRDRDRDRDVIRDRDHRDRDKTVIITVKEVITTEMLTMIDDLLLSTDSNRILTASIMGPFFGHHRFGGFAGESQK